MTDPDIRDEEDDGPLTCPECGEQVDMLFDGLCEDCYDDQYGPFFVEGDKDDEDDP